jgi:hypothetical protein
MNPIKNRSELKEEAVSRIFAAAIIHSKISLDLV